MDQLNAGIVRYLKSKTDYAILLTGKWGVGKTHYYKNTLTPIIEKEEPIDGSEKFKSIHISLFGLNSIEDIQVQIFLSLHKYMKTKSAKLAFGLSKMIVRGMLAFNKLGTPEDYFSDVKSKEGTLIKLDQLVICFDDFERRSPNLDLKELVGYINSLVEVMGAKIILITNQNEIDQNSLSELKDKVIGVTYEYAPEMTDQIESVLDQRFKHSVPFFSFLQKHKKTFQDFYELYDSNLRTLIFSLDNLQLVYSEIMLENPDKGSEKDKIVLDKIENIIRFSLAISIEFKKNEITLSNKNNLDGGPGVDFTLEAFRDVIANDVDVNEEIEKSYRETFISKYYKSYSDYKYYNSLYSYLTGAKKFDYEALLKEVKKAFHIEGADVSPQYKVYNELGYGTCYLLSEREYRKYTRNMVRFAEQGLYQIKDYVTVFHFALRFNNVLNYDPIRLKKKIIKGINKTKFDLLNTSILETHLDIPSDSENIDELNEIRREILLRNKKLCQEHDRNEASELIKRLYECPEAFIDDWSNKKNQLYDTSLFKYASAYKFRQVLNSSSNNVLRKFLYLIRTRYTSESIDIFKDEFTFLYGLHSKLNPISKNRQKGTVRNYLLDSIYEALSIVLKMFD